VREETQEEWNKSEERGTQERSDNRRIRISRPLREIGTKECAVWAFWTGLRVVGKERVPEAKQSISGLTKGALRIQTLELKQ
jgi:cytoplasmic tRNA 2-thiolation protein 2